MATLDQEKRELADKFALGKALTNENASVNNEPYSTGPIAASNDLWADTVPTNPGPVAGQYNSGGVKPTGFTVTRFGDLGTPSSIFRLYTVPSTGPATGQEQAFLTVYQQPASDSMSDVNAVREQNIVPSRFTNPSLENGIAHAGKTVAADRGYRMLLIPALTGGVSPTPDTANAITALNPTINTSIDPSGAASRVTVDYKSGIVRLSIPPGTGVATQINPNGVYDSNGRVILFAIFFQYTGDVGGGGGTAADISFTPTLGLTSTNVQDALEELTALVTSTTALSAYVLSATLADLSPPGTSLVGADAISAGSYLPSVSSSNLDTQLSTIYSNIDTVIASLASNHFGIVTTGLSITNPSAQIVRIPAGFQFALFDGTLINFASLTDFDPAVVGSLTRYVFWDTSAGTLAVGASSSVTYEDFPLVKIKTTTSVLTDFVVIAPRSRGVLFADEFIIGDSTLSVLPSHFDDIYSAVEFTTAFASSVSIPARFVITNDLTIGEQTGLPGTVDVDGGGSVTGTSTRLLRDFGAGDWIKIGSSWAKVATVTADSGAAAMTLTGWSGGALVGQPYTRANWVGPHARLRQTDLGPYQSTFIGQAYGNTSAPKPRITWGDPAVNETVPFFEAGPGFGQHASIEHLEFLYNGTLNPVVSHDHCWFKNPSNDCILKDVEVFAQGGLYHAFRHTIYGPGSSPGLYAHGCEFINFIGTEVSHVYTEEESGYWRFEHTRFWNGMSGLYDCVWECTSTTDNDEQVIFEDCEFLDVNLAIFIHNVTIDAKRKTLDNCLLGLTTATGPKIAMSARMGSVDGRRVSLSNCAFDDDWDMEGTFTANQCFVTDSAVNIIYNGLGTYVGCDFDTVGSATGTPLNRHDEVIRLSNPGVSGNNGARTINARLNVAAWGWITCNGLGSIALQSAGSSDSGANCTLSLTGSNDARVTFAPTIDSYVYSVTATPRGNSAHMAVIGTVGANFVDIRIYDSAGAQVNLSTTAKDIFFIAVGLHA